jgi:argininosuccinate synthase
VELGFERGVPVSVNGIKMNGVDLISVLNVIAGRHGVGILDMVENRVVGMKSRGVYETPAGTLIMAAHAKLEELCLDRKTMSFKQQVAQRFAELLYEGDWFSPLMEALCSFVDSLQDTISGTVNMKLYKGGIIAAGASSPYSLYDHSLASFATGPLFDHQDAAGFINLLALPNKARGLMRKRRAIEMTRQEEQAQAALHMKGDEEACVTESAGSYSMDLTSASHIGIVAAAKSHTLTSMACAS